MEDNSHGPHLGILATTIIMALLVLAFWQDLLDQGWKGNLFVTMLIMAVLIVFGRIVVALAILALIRAIETVARMRNNKQDNYSN